MYINIHYPKKEKVDIFWAVCCCKKAGGLICYTDSPQAGGKEAEIFSKTEYGNTVKEPVAEARTSVVAISADGL